MLNKRRKKRQAVSQLCVFINDKCRDKDSFENFS
jgi:hypothetical protein